MANMPLRCERPCLPASAGRQGIGIIGLSLRLSLRLSGDGDVDALLKVSRIIDATAIVPIGSRSPDDVLNGIAKLGKGRYLLTGKRWTSYYEVTFVDSSPNNPS